MRIRKRYGLASALPVAGLLLALTGCDKPAPTAGQAPDTEQPPAAEPTPAAAEDLREAEMAAREAEVARREAELQLKEREQAVARTEAELAARQAAVKAQAPRPAPPPATAATPPKPAPPPPPAPITIPAGTQLQVELISGVSTKTAKSGQAVDARLAADVLVDGKLAIAAGAPVRGTVTDVVSGSQEIGATPVLGITFDQITAADGKPMAITGRVVQEGKSEKGRDTAKIAGGSVIGAVIGHQIDSGSGKFVGAVLGGVAGAVAAKHTGTEVELAPGTLVGFQLTAPIQVKAK